MSWIIDFKDTIVMVVAPKDAESFMDQSLIDVSGYSSNGVIVVYKLRDGHSIVLVLQAQMSI